jgi:hypothetical protein
MEHSALTAEIKEGARRPRRCDDKSLVLDELAHSSVSDQDLSSVLSYLARVSSFDQQQSQPELPEGPFILLVASASARGEEAVLGRFAGELLDAGAVYVCCWGESADALETAFDRRIVEKEVEAGREFPLVMTTSHSGESLAEAVWFWLRTAWPPPEQGDRESSRLAICVGDDPSADRIEDWLANPSALDREVGLQ